MNLDRGLRTHDWSLGTSVPLRIPCSRSPLSSPHDAAPSDLSARLERRDDSSPLLSVIAAEQIPAVSLQDARSVRAPRLRFAQHREPADDLSVVSERDVERRRALHPAAHVPLPAFEHFCALRAGQVEQRNREVQPACGSRALQHLEQALLSGRHDRTRPPRTAPERPSEHPGVVGLVLVGREELPLRVRMIGG